MELTPDGSDTVEVRIGVDHEFIQRFKSRAGELVKIAERCS